MSYDLVCIIWPEHTLCNPLGGWGGLEPQSLVWLKLHAKGFLTIMEFDFIPSMLFKNICNSYEEKQGRTQNKALS